MADVDMDVDPPATKGKKEGKDAGKPRFEVKKVQSCSSRTTTPISSLTYLYGYSGTLCLYGRGV